MEKEKIAKIAKICHQANKAYCETLGDFSQKDWEEVSPHIRQSAIAGVTSLLENPSLTSEDIHKVWSKYKRDNGWVYGEKKSEENKTHNCLVDYSELPEEQRVKDKIFSSIVRSFI